MRRDWQTKGRGAIIYLIRTRAGLLCSISHGEDSRRGAKPGVVHARRTLPPVAGARNAGRNAEGSALERRFCRLEIAPDFGLLTNHPRKGRSAGRVWGKSIIVEQGRVDRTRVKVSNF